MKENKNMWQVDNLPNRLTIMRMILVPIFIGMCLCGIYFPENGKSFYTWAGITFITAAITDFLDGYIARKKNLVTHFGSFLDPIADKFLVTSALIMLLSAGKIHVIIVVVLILREVFITALRSFA
ncbi:MAG: CDP-diacylglycerol--glycerol-3-phosphate 3-phosphatidyltransferase, partial [Minisyncoccia bacterium]